jgi:hypothetical protein
LLIDLIGVTIGSCLAFILGKTMLRRYSSRFSHQKAMLLNDLEIIQNLKSLTEQSRTKVGRLFFLFVCVQFSQITY